MTERSGYELPLLLLGAFRAIINDLHAELARRGHPDARPIHGFALQAIGPGGATVSELGKRLGVSKQAAAKTARNLEETGYATRAPHPGDGRAWVLTRTPRGTEFLQLSAEIFDQQRQRWSARLGEGRLRELEEGLAVLNSESPWAALHGLPGWIQ